MFLHTKTKQYWQENQELLDKNNIEIINDRKLGKYGKDFIKIKFNSDDNLPLKKTEASYVNNNCKIYFWRRSKVFSQPFLDKCLYELKKCYGMK